MNNGGANIELRTESVLKSIHRLSKRIEDRFPDSSLLQTCYGFIQVVGQSQRNIDFINRPNMPMRIFTAVIIVLGILGVIYSLIIVDVSFGAMTFVDLVTVAEAIINDILLLGAAIFFLITLEVRLKRTRALKILDQLRSVAHVIDMHQLTKDPTMIGVVRLKTYNSPERTLNKFELQRYLDYCSELLALIGKVAALYAHNFSDDVIVGSVNDIETLTSGMSRKVWQKIMILANMEDPPVMQVKLD